MLELFAMMNVRTTSESDQAASTPLTSVFGIVQCLKPRLFVPGSAVIERHGMFGALRLR
jgi:hypothetical protein